MIKSDCDISEFILLSVLSLSFLFLKNSDINLSLIGYF